MGHFRCLLCVTAFLLALRFLRPTGNDRPDDIKKQFLTLVNKLKKRGIGPSPSDGPKEILKKSMDFLDKREVAKLKKIIYHYIYLRYE